MKNSLFTEIGKLIKKTTGIKDISLFKKTIHKNIGKIIYRKKYNTRELINLMKNMGMQKGSVVCIHASMKEFYNYQGTAKDLIDSILEVIDVNEGTLMMPAFPIIDKSKDDYVFDPRKDKTGAGFLAETFRKYPGVCRSINVQHSVCAIGKYAEWLTKDHANTHDCWGDNSPWLRLCELGGLVFNMGLPRSYMGTFHHCVESVLQYEHPYWKQFFTKYTSYKYYDVEGQIKTYHTYESDLERRTREKNVTRFFTEKDWKIDKISNLEIKVFYLENCFPKMLSLGRKGICVYYIPSPKKFYEKKSN